MTLKVWHCSDPPFKDISSALETSYFKQMVYQHQIPIQSVSTMHILYFWNANNIWLGILTLNIDTNIVQIKFCESRILFGQVWQGALSPRRTIEGRTAHRVPSKPGQGQNWFPELEKKLRCPKLPEFGYCFVWMITIIDCHYYHHHRIPSNSGRGWNLAPGSSKRYFRPKPSTFITIHWEIHQMQEGNRKMTLLQNVATFASSPP